MIGIKGIRLTTLSLTRDSSSGQFKPTGEYEILTTTDKVLAKQSIGGYGGIEVPPSIETSKLINALLASYSKDIGVLGGLEETAG